MADKGVGSSGGDWTAGIVAIAAAVLLGSAVPIGLYFGLYKPKVADHAKANEKLTQLKVDMQNMVVRSEKVRTLEVEGDEMAARVVEIEVPFAVADPDKMDVPEALDRIQRLALDHNLELLPERRSQLGAKVVYKANNRIEFEHGLRATKLRIEAQAFFHDFGRFVAELEQLEKFVVVPEALICRGDTNGGTSHLFIMEVYVIERRDVDRIGR